MKVLWFTNGPMAAVQRRMGRAASGSGHWMTVLLEHLVRTPGLEIEVATIYPGLRDESFEEGGVRYILNGQPKLPGIFFHCRNKDLQRTVEIVRERAPDLVHIHGTERFFGLIAARRLISTPCVISLQGLLGACAPRFFGALSPGDICRCTRVLELATRRGLLWQYEAYLRGARYEREILAGATAFLGRTDWDLAQIRSVNATASYCHVGEVLRPAFQERRWDLSECVRRTIIFTNAGEPRRGTETLVQAMLTVRREFPDARLRLVGSRGAYRGYARFLQRMIDRLGLSEAIEFLGYLDGSAMARELSRAHAFVLPSYIENSPNSLCEAMQVGLPCVATYAGGIPSLVDGGRTGLLFPAGDAALLARAILRIFRDDDLARRLSRQAREEALERHAPRRIVSQVLDAYARATGNRQGANCDQTVAQA